MQARSENTPGRGRGGFAEVAVDGAGGQERTFTYRIPEGVGVEPGHLVWVPFGTRTVQGIVFRLTEFPAIEETRDIERIAHERPLLSERQITVARWMSTYYRVGLFLAAVQMLPPGFASRLRTWVAVDAERASDATLTRDLGPRDIRALRMAEEATEIRREALSRRLGRGGGAVVDRLIRRKLLVTRSEWEQRRQKPRFVRVLTLDRDAEDVERTADKLDAISGGRGIERASLLRRVIDSPGRETQADLAREFGRSRVDWAKRSGHLRVDELQVERDPLAERQFQTSMPLDPTAAQAGAIGAITSALRTVRNETGPPRKFLLFGITGSGKTEVYLRAAEKCLELGRSVLVLVPEIALTPQTLSRFASRFPGKVALLHSGLQPGERFDQWWRIANGDFPIVLGSRSAVFAPIRDLGLVVIDEEHEWTYKQHDPAPRYHARAVAERFCIEHGAVLVAGSATPDVETFRRARQSDFYLLRLPARVGIEDNSPGFASSGRAALLSGPDRTSAGQAGVSIVDMREELRSGNAGLFSGELHRGIGDSLDAGGRVILFLNRRGSAAYVQCRECGTVRSCRRCDTSLTMHSSDLPDGIDSLVCHYCGYRVRPSAVCRVCNAENMRPMGSGTQSVVAEVERRFPDAGVLRWDRDVARTARAHSEVLDRFLKGESRVLVGTQMVAKGLDIPEVTLVGVISADTGLAIPDFRAGERAFQVLTQVAGRVGRGPEGGSAIIQTFQPEHYAIQAAAAQDFEAFYEIEIGLRADHADPPFTRLIRLGHSHYDAPAALEEAKRVAAVLNDERTVSGETGTEVIGPSPSYPFRMRGVTRWHIILKGAHPERLLDRVTLGRDWTVDVDPASVS
ncbi:MAG: primosomal protein N' [Chloroflexi bacterium]|nr:primosomal protein N' [Chloroflexota bacterium]